MMLLKYDGARIATHIEYATTMLQMSRGLMFRKDIPDDYALVFVSSEPKNIFVHALFMRFPIDAIFLNEDKIIIDIARLNPWSGYRYVKNVAYLIEMNAGTSDRYELATGTGLVFDAVATSI